MRSVGARRGGHLLPERRLRFSFGEVRLVLALEIFEGGEKRLRVFGRQSVVPQPGKEGTLFGDMLGALPDMPPEHLDLGFLSGHS